MQTFDINQGKKEKAIKQVVKANVKHLKGFAKFCYGLTIFLRILAAALGLANVLYVVLFSHNALDIIYLIMSFGFPYGFSLLSATVYFITASGEYRFRGEEKIAFAGGGFEYIFRDSRTGLTDTLFVFRVLYENIGRHDYDDKTKVLTLHGKIIGDTYENGELKVSDEYNEITLLDAYGFSVKRLLDENCRHGE